MNILEFFCFLLTPFQKSGQGIVHRCVIAMCVCVCVLIADKALASNSHLIRPFLYYFRSWIDLILFWRHYYLPILLFGKIQLTFEREKKERKDMSLGNKTLMVEVVLLDSFKWFSNRENSHFFVKSIKVSVISNLVPTHTF